MTIFKELDKLRASILKGIECPKREADKVMKHLADIGISRIEARAALKLFEEKFTSNEGWEEYKTVVTNALSITGALHIMELIEEHATDELKQRERALNEKEYIPMSEEGDEVYVEDEHPGSKIL